MTYILQAGTRDFSIPRAQDVPSGVALAHRFNFVPAMWQRVNLSLEGLCEGTDTGDPAASAAQRALAGCRARLRPLFEDRVVCD